VDKLSILGVSVEKKLTWKEHITNLTARAGQKLGALRRVATKLGAAGKVSNSQCNGVCFAMLDECICHCTWTAGLYPEESFSSH